MSYTFRPASRSQAKPLIGLYAESGAGKTMSALLLARGFVGPQGRIAMIETESGRGEAYADAIEGSYQVVSLRQDFSPRAYGQAITAAEEAGYDALIIDSASHEWAGAGGVLSMAAKNQEAGKKNMAVWQLPKGEHNLHFMLRLQQTPIPLVIVCMRAKYPMQEVYRDGKKVWERSASLEPIQADDILFEMFVHGWIDKERHAFHGTKYQLDSLRAVLRDGEPISLDTGRALAEWSRGTPQKPQERLSEEEAAEVMALAREAAQAGTEAYRAYFAAISPEQRRIIAPEHEALKALAAERTEGAPA
jgi:hypothetical protein